MSWQENIAQFGLPAGSVKSSCSSKPLSFQNDGDHRADPVWLTVCPSRFCHTGSWSGYQEMLELIPADTREQEPKNGRQPGQSPVCHPVSNWWDREWARNNTWSKNGPFDPTVETLARTLLEHAQQNANLAIEEWIWLQTQPGPSWQVGPHTWRDVTHGELGGIYFLFTVFLYLNSSKVHVNEWLLTQTWPQWRASFPDAPTI